MRTSGERRLAASRDAVWVALGEPDVLRRCLPGCESIERVSDVEFDVSADVRPPAAAPAPFAGSLRLDEVDPPAGTRFALELKGSGGERITAAGRVDLVAEGEATLLRYELGVDAGKALPAAEPARLDEAVRGLAEAFFSRFETALALHGPESAARAAPPAPAGRLTETERAGLRPSVWVPALMLAVALILHAAS